MEPPSFLNKLPVDSRRSVEKVLRLTSLPVDERLSRIQGKVTSAILKKCKEFMRAQVEEETSSSSESEESENSEESSSDEENSDESDSETESDSEEVDEEDEEEENSENPQQIVDPLEEFRHLAQLEINKILQLVERRVMQIEGRLKEADKNRTKTIEKSTGDRVDFARKMLREEVAFTGKTVSRHLLGYSYAAQKEKKKKNAKEEETPMRECIVCMMEYDQPEMIVCTAVNDEEKGSECHFVCEDCVRGNTEANKADGKIAEDGTGWPCYSGHGCNRIILWAHIRKLLEEKTVTHLEKRFDAAALREFDGEMEYCKTCNFGAFLERGPHIQKWFTCMNQECKAAFCRICKIDQQAHLGKSCDEADPVRKANKERRQKLVELEEFLSAAKVRICTKCRKHFTKDADGSCNKMTCSECGTTMCYICKQSNITYDHFGDNRCQLFTDTNETDRLLYANAVQEAQKDPHMNELLIELRYQPQ